MNRSHSVFSFWALSIGFLGFFWTAQKASAVEIAFEQDTRLPIVYVNLAFKGGAVTDPSGQEGIAHFMGEMLLRGTRSHTKEQINLILDQMGAQLHVETRAESLILRGAVLNSQLSPFLELMSEIVTEPSFPDSEIKKLKGETISRLQQELGDDGSLAARGFNRFLFRGHPYGKSILGKTQDIEKLTRSDIQEDYQRLFRKDLILVVGYGDSTQETLSNWANQLVQKLPQQPDDVNPPTSVPAPTHAKQRRLLIIDKPDRTQTQMNIGQIGITMKDPDFFPLHLGNYAFGGPSFSSTLMVEIRVKRGWSYGANSAFRYGLEPRSWHAHLFPAEKDTPEALALTLKLIEEMRSNGISKEQFEFSQKSLVNNAGFNYNTPKKRVENILLEKTLNLPEGFMKSFGPELAKVQLDEVNSALKKFLKPERLAIAVLGTAKNLKESLAKASGIAEENVQIVPYTQED